MWSKWVGTKEFLSALLHGSLVCHVELRERERDCRAWIKCSRLSIDIGTRQFRWLADRVVCSALGDGQLPMVSTKQFLKATTLFAMKSQIWNRWNRERNRKRKRLMTALFIFIDSFSSLLLLYFVFSRLWWRCTRSCWTLPGHFNSMSNGNVSDGSKRNQETCRCRHKTSRCWASALTVKLFIVPCFRLLFSSYWLEFFFQPTMSSVSKSRHWPICNSAVRHPTDGPPLSSDDDTLVDPSRLVCFVLFLRVDFFEVKGWINQ